MLLNTFCRQEFIPLGLESFKGGDIPAGLQDVESTLILRCVNDVYPLGTRKGIMCLQRELLSFLLSVPSES